MLPHYNEADDDGNYLRARKYLRKVSDINSVANLNDPFASDGDEDD